MARRSRSRPESKPLPSPQIQPLPEQVSRRGFFQRIMGWGRSVATDAKSEATTFKPAHKMSRREFLARAGIGLTGLFGGYKLGKHVGRRMPFWVGAEKKYNLVLGFTSHATRKDLEPVFAAIENAKRAGNPIKLFLNEDAAASVETFVSDAVNFNNFLAELNQHYRQLLSQGATPEMARKFVEAKYSSVHPEENEFQAGLMSRLAIEGIKVVPIEAHSPEEIQRNIGYLRFLQDKNAKVYSALYSGASILELQRIDLEGRNTIQKAMDAYRDARARETIQTVFDTAVQIFPELGREEKIHALGFMGGAHRQVYLDFRPKKRSLAVSEIKNPESYSLDDFVTKSRASRERDYSEKDARLTVLGGFFDPVVSILKENGRMDLVKKGFFKALGMSQKEFEQLSNEAQKIRDPQNKGVFAINYLVGEKYF